MLPTLGLLHPEAHRAHLASWHLSWRAWLSRILYSHLHGQICFFLLGRKGNLGIRSAIASPTANSCSEEKRESSALQPSGRRDDHVLPRLGREEESSMDGEAFSELEALLMNATPLSRIFQNMRGNSHSECDKGGVLMMPTFDASLSNYFSLGTLYIIERLRRRAFREQARAFQFSRVHTLPCPLAKIQITSNTVSRESVRKDHLLYTYGKGKKKGPSAISLRHWWRRGCRRERGTPSLKEQMRSVRRERSDGCSREWILC